MNLSIKIDSRIYSDVCISKAIYSLSDSFSFLRKKEGYNEILEVIAREDYLEDTIKSIVYNRLNDFKLRCIINEETNLIKDLLYAKAFAYSEEVQNL